MYGKQILKDTWYTYFKKKYKLTDDDIDEYIDSFESINKGNEITAAIMADFVNQEINHNDTWNVKECLNIIKQLNLIVNKKDKITLDLPTYLCYIIPICQEYVVNKIGIKELFDELDTDRDGKVICKDLISLLYKINRNFSPKDLETYRNKILTLCKKADSNHDGYLDLKEFKEFMSDIIIKKVDKY